MAEIKSKLQKWGNSFGVVIPKKVVAENKLKEGDEIEIIFNKKEKGNVLRESFGTVKFKKSTEQMMKETDEELYDV